MTPFDRVLAACRAALRNTSADYIDDAILGLAAHHGVLPLLPSNESAYASQVRSIAQRQLKNCQELRRIADALHGAVDFITLKGPALSLQLYGSIGLRESIDLDILVRPRDVPLALHRLSAIDYTTEGREPVAFRHWLQHQHELLLLNRSEDVLLEVQWAWAQRHFVIDRDIDACFAESRHLSLAGADLRVLSPEDTLIYLAVHGAKHGWSSLSLVTDFAAAGLRLDVDWPVVTRRAQQHGLHRLLEIGGALSESLFGIAMPIRSSSAAAALSNRFEQRLRADDRGQSVRLFVSSRERSRDRMRAWWRLASTPNPSDTAWIALPDRWFKAYYLMRPIRLLLKPFARKAVESASLELPGNDVFGNLSDHEATLLEQASGRR